MTYEMTPAKWWRNNGAGDDAAFCARQPLHKPIITKLASLSKVCYNRINFI